MVWPSLVIRACGLLLALGSTCSILAQEPKRLHAFRIAGEGPRIDGQLDDAVWAAAEAIDDLVQGEPANLEPPTERTVVQVAYDNRNIYVAVYCYIEDPANIAAGLGRRDNFPPSDRIEILFDPRHDRQTGYVFQTNPSGVQGDYTLFDDINTSFDYDGVWNVATDISATGWTAEFQIPLSQMRFISIETGETVWGFNVQRDIYRKGEWDRWIANARGERGNVSRFGELVFREPFSPPRRMEFTPFMLGRSDHLPGAGPDRTLSAGFDFRYGIGTSTTFAATINPDFGQVEQDPAVLNLSVFETQFQEKRAFFLEDSRVFVLPYAQFPDFYSPRIGRAPGRYALEDGDRLISQPNRTRILGAAKITGKQAGWTYGGLTALTSPEYATVETTAIASDGTSVTSTFERLIEPRTSYNVGRLQRDIASTSNVGVIGTAVVREDDMNAFVGGVDGNFRWDQNRYSWNTHWVGTRAPVDGVERSGIGGATNFNFTSRNFGVSGHYDHFSRWFKNSDLGFFTNRPNKSRANGGFTLIEPDGWKALRYISGFLGVGQSWTGDDLTIDRSINSNVFMQFVNFWTARIGINRNFQAFSDVNARGGPTIVVPASTFVNFNVDTDSRKTWRLSVFGNSSGDSEGGWQASFGSDLRVQPSDRLQASVNARYTTAEDSAQWIANEDITGDGESDSIFGRLYRDVIDVRVRATYAFSRDLTLEVYMQPFVSVGDYFDIGRLVRAKSFDFDPASVAEDPDFNRKSLRSNVVLRWEYQRGSTLFFVWQMSSSDPSNSGVFNPWQDFGRAFGGDRTNIFMIKSSYWLGF